MLAHLAIFLYIGHFIHRVFFLAYSKINYWTLVPGYHWHDLLWDAASMVNKVFCNSSLKDSTLQQLTSDTTIEVAIDIPFPFRAIPVQAIESSGTQVLEQLLRVMLPRFLNQLVKDYQAWASGDSSRKPLGTGEIWTFPARPPLGMIVYSVELSYRLLMLYRNPVQTSSTLLMAVSFLCWTWWN